MSADTIQLNEPGRIELYGERLCIPLVFPKDNAEYLTHLNSPTVAIHEITEVRIVDQLCETGLVVPHYMFYSDNRLLMSVVAFAKN